MKKQLFIFMGFLSFGLGAIGAILPILPTTPFLLLSGYCFTRSSKKFDAWLRQTKLFHLYVADFVENRTIPRKKKWKIEINICVLMTISILMVPLLIIKIFLAILTVFISLYLFFKIPDSEVKTYTKTTMRNKQL